MPSHLEHAQAIVDGFLLRLGLDGDVTEEGFWTARCGSTVVVVSAFEDDATCYVRVAALIVTGARTSLDLLTRLLRLNAETLYGAFQLFDDQTVAFTHTMPLEGLSFEQFHRALVYVATVADDHDEQIQSLAGGQRADDLLDEPPSA
jgi:hypothetical protein